MKKVLTRKVIFFLSLFLISMIYYKGSAQAENKKSGDYEYSVSGNKVTIVKYIGSKNNVTIPSKMKGKKVVKIGDSAFADCTKVEKITIPNSVQKIGDEAFSRCKKLGSITIPSSVTTIGDSSNDYFDGSEEANVFKGCTSLSAIYVDKNNTDYSSINGVLYDKDQIVLYRCPEGFTGSISIPDTVLSIEKGAFMSSDITEVMLPTTIEELPVSAFYECKKLTTILLPESLKDIGEHAFYNCSALKNIEIPGGIDKIKQGTFSGCTGLISVKLPMHLNSIGAGAFSNCKVLTEIQLPEGLETIEYMVFDYCETIQSITIPKTVKKLGDNFSGCTSLKQINVDKDNPIYSTVDGVLYNKAIDRLIRCPQGFEGDITIPKGVKTIESFAFYRTKFKRLEFPNGVEDIEPAAIWECKNLTNLVFPKTLSFIGSVYDVDFESRFKNCSKLKCIEVDVDNKYFYSKDGILFGGNKNSTKGSLVCYPAAKKGKTYRLPKGINIAIYAFDNCAYLKKIIIPEGIHSLYSICANSKNITVEIPKSVKHFPVKYGDYRWFINNKKCVVSVYKNSAAMKYAKKNKIPYKIRK